MLNVCSYNNKTIRASLPISVYYPKIGLQMSFLVYLFLDHKTFVEFPFNIIILYFENRFLTKYGFLFMTVLLILTFGLKDIFLKFEPNRTTLRRIDAKGQGYVKKFAIPA